MRKALKPKALLLFTSWFVIFMHGVIPHMHSNDNVIDMHSGETAGHFSCAHSHTTDFSDIDVGLYLNSQHQHSTDVCHFNPNLYSQLDIDFSFIHAPEGNIIYSDLNKDIRVPDTQARYKKPPLLPGSALRAPPLV